MIIDTEGILGYKTGGLFLTLLSFSPSHMTMTEDFYEISPFRLLKMQIFVLISIVNPFAILDMSSRFLVTFRSTYLPIVPHYNIRQFYHILVLQTC